MGDRELVLHFESHAELAAEHARDLGHGRAFVRDVTDVPLFSRAVLRLEVPVIGVGYSIDVEVVMVLADGAMRGSALQFVDRSERAKTALAAFVDLCVSEGRACMAETQGDVEQGGEAAPDDTDEMVDSRASRDRQVKLRGLSLAERTGVARGGSLEDRNLLERIYGVLVWEALLRNPKVSVPEVARIARKGTIPRPLLELIVENDSWIRQGIVRRALLSNPRLSSDGAARVLRTLSNRELKLVPQQTAYPALVRTAAQRLLRTT